MTLSVCYIYTDFIIFLLLLTLVWGRLSYCNMPFIFKKLCHYLIFYFIFCLKYMEFASFTVSVTVNYFVLILAWSLC